MTLELLQGSEAWRHARCGKVTASRVADVVAKTKAGWGASRKNYRAELVVERLTGKPKVHFASAAMQRGTELEPYARQYYEITRGVTVATVGFVPHPKIAMTGASPDGLIDNDGGVEIKCPLEAAHIETLKTEKLSDEYFKQIVWNLACHPERQWWEYVSYNPDLPPEMQFFTKRIYRASEGVHECLTDLEREVPIFLKEVEDEVAALCAKYSYKLPVAA